MAVTLPTGWTDFSSGGSDPTLCGEEQGCLTPPCSATPPITIITTSPLLCDEFGIRRANLEITGGVPPFEWDTTEGEITVTGVRTAEIVIPTINLFPGESAFAYVVASCFQASTVLPPASPDCGLAYVVRTTWGCYDCNGVLLGIGGFGEGGCDYVPPVSDELTFNMDGLDCADGSPLHAEGDGAGGDPQDDFLMFPGVGVTVHFRWDARGIDFVTEPVFIPSGLTDAVDLTLSPNFSVRSPEMIALGCGVCSDSTVIVTATDAEGNSTIIELVWS